MVLKMEIKTRTEIEQEHKSTEHRLFNVIEISEVDYGYLVNVSVVNEQRQQITRYIKCFERKQDAINYAKRCLN